MVLFIVTSIQFSFIRKKLTFLSVKEKAYYKTQLAVCKKLVTRVVPPDWCTEFIPVASSFVQLKHDTTQTWPCYETIDEKLLPALSYFLAMYLRAWWLL